MVVVRSLFLIISNKFIKINFFVVLKKLVFLYKLIEKNLFGGNYIF